MCHDCCRVECNGECHRDEFYDDIPKLDRAYLEFNPMTEEFCPRCRTIVPIGHIHSIPPTLRVMITPKSDAALEKFPEFTALLRKRLEAGKAVYGDKSFDSSMTQLVEEIRQELLDQAGWAFIAYQRLAEVERQITSLAQILLLQADLKK